MPLTSCPPIGARRADYLSTAAHGTLPDGTPYNVPYYALTREAAPVGAATITANRDGYHQQFVGFELSATKRLSNRWMARFGFSWNSAREYLDDRATAIVDPTSSTVDPQVNGGLVTVRPPAAASRRST